MSHAATHDHGHAGAHDHDEHGPDLATLLRADNVQAPASFGLLSMVLIFAGLAGLAGTLVYAFTGGESGLRHALFSHHVGAVIALGLALGPLGVVMIFHQVSAGWSVTIRRQMENAAALAPLGVLLLVPSLLKGKEIFHWWAVDPASDPVLEHKASFLNPTFFLIRIAVYAVIWTYLGARMRMLSLQQDASGDRWLTSKAKFTSAWGLLAFALSVAFAGFDLLKSMDYHWFSTMFGVYFFAGNMIVGLSLMAVVFSLIRGGGKLKGLVTAEHFHDLGKLMLGFTIFWAYIGFSQYFLIWYANVPEETAWMIVRKQGGWEKVGLLLMFGHFLGPFLILLFRDVKKSLFLGVVGAWMILMHCADIFWVVRPILFAGKADPVGFAWVDITGVFGPVLLFIGLLLWLAGRSPLIPIKDPRLPEAAAHKNYV